MGTRILKIDLEMTEIIDPKVGNPQYKEAKSAIKMILSKSSLSHVLCCNLINFCLRSRPVTPNVVRPSVSSNVEINGMMT